MAMSDTGSNPTDWAQFYHRIASSGQVPPPHSSGMIGGRLPGVAESVVVTTTATNTSPSSSCQNTAAGCASSASLSIEGRVGKSPRRRSRASRRAPTTLLNTDPANFRAMVQQFTGVPSEPFLSGGGTTTNIGFGGQPRAQTVVIPTTQNYQFHYQQQQQQHQQQQQQQVHVQGQLHHQREGGIYPVAHTGDSFFQAFGNHRSNMDGSDDFSEGLSAQMLARQGSGGGNNPHGYNF